MHVGDGSVVEIFAPDEGRQLAQKAFAGRKIARARARLDQRGALPILPAAFVIIECSFGRDRDLRRGRIGSKPQIDAKHVTVFRTLLEKLYQFARDAHEKRRRLHVGRERAGRRIEKHDEVDVAGKVQLAAAHLSHGEHDVAGARSGIAGVARR